MGRETSLSLRLAAGPYSVGIGALQVAVTGFEAAFASTGLTALVGFSVVVLVICDPVIDASDAETDTGGFAIFDRDGSNLLDPVFTLGVVSFLMAIGIAMFATLGDLINARLEQGAQMFGLQFAAFVFALIPLEVPIGPRPISTAGNRSLSSVRCC